MNTEQLDRIRTWFDDYVNSLFNASELRSACINLKVEHTRRVADNARNIARELGWSREAILTSEALGWLHDVGRFSQFAEFGHFHDATSINHAERGWQIVRESTVLSSLSAEDRGCLLEGIRYHNARTIPEETSAACFPFVKLIRDADKLDIYRVVIEQLQKDGFQELKNMWRHIELRGPITPRVLEVARTERNCSVADIKSLADFLLLQVSWVYELHYSPTFKRVAQQEILDAFARYLPDEEGPREVLEKAREYVSHAVGRHFAGGG